MPTYVKLLGSLVMLAISGLAALYEHSKGLQCLWRVPGVLDLGFPRCESGEVRSPAGRLHDSVSSLI